MTREKYLKQTADFIARIKSRGRKNMAARRQDVRKLFTTDEQQLAKLNRLGHGNCREAMRLYLRIRAKG